jgi:F-type H+-transporting ATPase subunit b
VEHAAEHAPSIADLWWPLVNFGLFAFLLVRQLKGPIGEFFRERASRLREQLAAGDRARREAEALRAQLAADLANLPALRERLKGDLRATAERERERILELAKHAAERIRTDTKLLAEQEVAAARRTLRDEVIETAIGKATELVRNAVQPQDQDRFVRDFVSATGAAS